MMAETKKTKGQEAAADVSALLRARHPLIVVRTNEEARAESLIMSAAAGAGYTPMTWDVAAGARDLQGSPVSDPRETADPMAMFSRIEANTKVVGVNAKRQAWIMRDLPMWLTGFPGAVPCRTLRNLARLLPRVPRESAQAIIMITPSSQLPDELAGHATVIEWPLPDRAEIAAILDDAISVLPDDLKANALHNGAREAAIDAAVGLAGEEAQACYAKSLVQHRRIEPATVANEKKRIIARERVLEWIDPIPGGLDAIGGLENLKAYLSSRKQAYGPKAKAYGLPTPKGCFLGGIPGCGKSLTAKCAPTIFDIPCLKLDLGALKSKFVGESEGNLRKALKVIEAIGRCVVWIDEIEKALQGATSGSADGGVSSDALGTFLSWMQERTSEAFVIATANDVESLPPELLRKGRFDELWWVDLPTLEERAAILKVALKAHGRQKVKILIDTVAGCTEGFTGSEVAALVPDALYIAFADKAREIVTADLLAAVERTTPLSKTAAEKITRLRKWGEDRARPASAGAAPRLALGAARQIDV